MSNKRGGGRKWGGGSIGTPEDEGFRELALTGLLPTLADGGGGTICMVTENWKRLTALAGTAQLLYIQASVSYSTGVLETPSSLEECTAGRCQFSRVPLPCSCRGTMNLIHEIKTAAAGALATSQSDKNKPFAGGNGGGGGGGGSGFCKEDHCTVFSSSYLQY